MFILQSFTIATAGLFTTLFSVGATVILYSWVFKVTYYSYIHNMAILLQFGNSADQIILLIDSWKTSECISQFDQKMSKRMAYIWRFNTQKVGLTILVQTLTIGAVIIGCPYIPVKSFCIYVCISFILNFLLNLIVITGLLIWTEVNLQENGLRKSKLVRSVSLRSSHEDDDLGHSHAGQIENCFKYDLNKFIGKFKFLILAAFAVWTAYMVILVSRYSHLSTDDRFLKAGDIVQINKEMVHREFWATDGFEIKIYFGIRGYNELFFLDEGQEWSQWEPTVVGGPVFDPLFDLTHENT